MSDRVVIGLLGQAGSGKSTAAKYLSEKYGFVEKSFASPLKRACRELFSLSDEQLDGSLKEVPDDRWYGATPRRMFQYIGTDLLRDNIETIMPGIGKDIFVKALDVSLQGIEKDIVVSDVRFANEIEYVNSIGGTVVRIVRDGQEAGNHITENHQNLTGYRMAVINDGRNLDAYHRTWDEVVKKILESK